MQFINIFNYTISVILMIMVLIKFDRYLRRMKKEKICLLSPPKSTYVFLLLGLVMLSLSLSAAYIAFFVKKGSEPYLWFLPFVIGLSQIQIFIDSRVIIAKQGIYISTIPFFIPKYNIENFRIEGCDLILKKKDSEKIYKIRFNSRDAKKMKNAINKLMKLQ